MTKKQMALGAGVSCGTVEERGGGTYKTVGGNWVSRINLPRQSRLHTAWHGRLRFAAGSAGPLRSNPPQQTPNDPVGPAPSGPRGPEVVRDGARGKDVGRDLDRELTR